jgi:oxygen-independent coproporphyrinogen-3 oxidase
MDEMTMAICNELRLQKDFLQSEVSTIYFGGGTPSLLSLDQLNIILEVCYKLFKVAPDAEITLEANPEDVTVQKVKDWIKTGVNRVSLGVQTFNDHILKELNRSHTSANATKAVELMQNSGLQNLTLDLIYGIPSQSTLMWEDNLRRATSLGVPHISSYALTIEPKTAFGNWLKKGKLNEVTDDIFEEEYSVMCEFLSAKGFSHYEVSNFAKPGFESRHNTSYWLQEPYLGVGPGAHSYNRQHRFFNISNNPAYIRSLKNGQVPNESEDLSEKNIYNEYLLTGLRTKAGLNLLKLEKEYGEIILKNHDRFITKCIDDKLLILEGNHLIPTDKGLFLADSIILELMIE